MITNIRSRAQELLLAFTDLTVEEAMILAECEYYEQQRRESLERSLEEETNA